MPMGYLASMTGSIIIPAASPSYKHKAYLTTLHTPAHPHKATNTWLFDSHNRTLWRKLVWYKNKIHILFSDAHLWQKWMVFFDRNFNDFVLLIFGLVVLEHLNSFYTPPQFLQIYYLWTYKLCEHGLNVLWSQYLLIQSWINKHTNQKVNSQYGLCAHILTSHIVCVMLQHSTITFHA